MPPKDPFRKWSQYFGPDFSPKHSYFLVCRVKITQTKRKKIQNWSKHRVKITSKRDYSVSKIFTALLALKLLFWKLLCNPWPSFLLQFLFILLALTTETLPHRFVTICDLFPCWRTGTTYDRKGSRDRLEGQYFSTQGYSKPWCIRVYRNSLKKSGCISGSVIKKNCSLEQKQL